jgi:hypothetical protein
VVYWLFTFTITITKLCAKLSEVGGVSDTPGPFVHSDRQKIASPIHGSNEISTMTPFKEQDTEYAFSLS